MEEAEQLYTGFVICKLHVGVHDQRANADPAGLFLHRQRMRNFYSVSISGYHIAEAGAHPIHQLAFTLANGVTYVEYYRSRGMHLLNICGPVTKIPWPVFGTDAFRTTTGVHAVAIIKARRKGDDWLAVKELPRLCPDLSHLG